MKYPVTSGFVSNQTVGGGRDRGRVRGSAEQADTIGRREAPGTGT